MTLKTVKKLAVLTSQSRCIFENLAFEDLLHRSVNFTQRDVLLTWSNDPAAVIGRHQNPWLETDVRFLEENDVKLARRNSGGGTVYHDLGNVNFSLLTSKARHNRCKNMKIVAEVLEECWNIKTKVSERNDLKLSSDGSKISGTAAKISSGSSYHHFTLLISVNLQLLHKALRPSVEVDIRVIGFQEMLKMFTDFEKTSTHFRTKEWIFEKTPNFRLQTSIHGEKCELTVEKGRIVRILPDNYQSKLTNSCFINMLFNEFLHTMQFLKK